MRLTPTTPTDSRPTSPAGCRSSFQQIIAALPHELELDLIAIDRGTTTYGGDPGAVVAAASGAREWATQAAHQMHRRITDAQDAVSAR